MEVANRFADVRITKKRGDHQKSTKQAGKGKDTAMATTTEGEIR
jgi:hypothetical protein